jgi:hypothetical protein
MMEIGRIIVWMDLEHCIIRMGLKHTKEIGRMINLKAMGLFTMKNQYK